MLLVDVYTHQEGYCFAHLINQKSSYIKIVNILTKIQIKIAERNYDFSLIHTSLVRE